MEPVKKKEATPVAKKEKVVKAPKAEPAYKTLTVEFNKALNQYEAFDENGKLYTAEDAPRQIMMHLAWQKKQVLYFRGKKWRRRDPNGQKPAVTVAPVPKSKDPVETKAPVKA